MKQQHRCRGHEPYSSPIMLKHTRNLMAGVSGDDSKHAAYDSGKTQPRVVQVTRGRILYLDTTWLSDLVAVAYLKLSD